MKILSTTSNTLQTQLTRQTNSFLKTKKQLLQIKVFAYNMLLLIGISLIQLNFMYGQCGPTCISSNTFTGTMAGVNNSGDQNSFYGFACGDANEKGDNNSFFGSFAGGSNVDANDNSFFGFVAGAVNKDGEGNSFFGSSAGAKNNSGMHNSFFGYNSGSQNQTGQFNSFFGYESGKNSTGSGNTYFGYKSGEINTSLSNVMMGSMSGQNNTGGFNTFLGFSAGSNSGAGTKNVYLGTSSGVSTRGSNNVFLGFQSGSLISGTSSRNIMIGNFAGPTFTTSLNDKLYIDVEQTAFPLIYGEFDNDHVVINGTFEVTAGINNQSSKHLKHKFETLNAASVLSKIVTMDISEWSYRAHTDQRHIGPIAEDFHAAFGLGKDDQSISTIDASGVALVAIQALNDELIKTNEALNSQLNQLIQRLEKLEASTH